MKALTKTPTRAIPDILGTSWTLFALGWCLIEFCSGFSILSKLEIKKDTKEINKGLHFVVSCVFSFV